MGMSFSFNGRNYIENVYPNGSTLVNYSYLADGTKFSALDDEGRGLELYSVKSILKSEAIHIDVNISPFKGVSGTKAVRAAREAADESLSPQVADGVRRQNAMLNAEKAAANQAISEGVGSVLGSVASKVIDKIQDKYRD